MIATSFAPTFTGFLCGVAFMVLVIGGVAWSVISLAKHATKVHDDLERFQRKARGAESLDELNTISKEVINYAQKNCYHRILSAHAREVLQYINGRRSKFE